MERNLIIGVIIIFLVSCQANQDKIIAENWYEEIKAEILKQSKLIADSVITMNDKRDSLRRERKSFYHGAVFFSELFYKGIKRGETYFSIERVFELRREICENNLISFEGIFINGEAYGPSTWKYCNGNLEKEGIRFKNKHIGIWYEWAEIGKRISQTDYKQMELLKSLPPIAKK
jgi:hypothetical protein